MKSYLSPKWVKPLKELNLLNFDQFWSLKGTLVEPPNHRRGGWSEMSYVDLAKGPSGEPKRLYIKRQKNHVFKNVFHPIQGRLTIEREFLNISQFQQQDIPAPTPVYFEVIQRKKDWYGILVTEELTGYHSLEETMQQVKAERDLKLKHQIITETAQLIRKLHNSKFHHCCLYPKHIFLKIPIKKDKIEIAFIDLEKARPFSFGSFGIRDLDTLYRHSPYISKVEAVRFLKAYLTPSEFCFLKKRFWDHLIQRYQKKTKSKQNKNWLQEASFPLPEAFQAGIQDPHA